jgi:hypothetical protein
MGKTEDEMLELVAQSISLKTQWGSHRGGWTGAGCSSLVAVRQVTGSWVARAYYKIICRMQKSGQTCSVPLCSDFARLANIVPQPPKHCEYQPMSMLFKYFDAFLKPQAIPN